MKPDAGTAGALRIARAPERAYLAPEEFIGDVEAELDPKRIQRHGRLILGPQAEVAFAQNVWLEPRLVKIGSIGDAVKSLRAVQRNWAVYAPAHHRRASLVAEGLPKLREKPFVFGEAVPTSPMGAFTLLAPDLMLMSASCSSPFPNGEVRFLEDKTGPPSRAYLKLWEALTVAGERPQAGELCLDLGSSPGGWTWALAKLGARVISVDKAPIEPSVAALPGVEVRSESAFGLEPKSLPPVDWLFSDVICYPARLIGLLERWLKAPKVPKMICSVKFQGATDFEAIRRLREIPGAEIRHLFHNKHEVTFFRLKTGAGGGGA